MSKERDFDGIFTTPPAGRDDLWTGEVAELAGVTKMTIVRWADAGKVACSRTLGGDRRFARAEVARLLAELGRPVPEWLAPR